MRFIALFMIILSLPVLGIAMIMTLPTSANAEPSDPVYGLWLTENKRAAVDIQPCGKSLCGTVAWIIDGGMRMDEHNPDPHLRNRPICGLKILLGFKKDAPGEWSGGKIYDAKQGKIYKSNILAKDDNTLFLRGYIGMPLFGKTQKWTRLDDDHPRCHQPAPKPH